MENQYEMVKCGSCHQDGHMKTNKKCPNYESYLQTNKKTEKKLIEDPITEDWLRRRFISVRNYVVETIELSTEVGGIIRLPNIPEDLTENICKFIVRNILGNDTCVWCKGVGLPGDLHSESEKVMETKSFTSDGPCSFGPKKKFDTIYFLDLRSWLTNEIVLYRVSLSNESSIWKELKMNKNETFDKIAKDGKRPHISWEKILGQLTPDSYKEVYRGTFERIFRLPSMEVVVPL
jgi:hypothetical protein